VAVPVAVLAAAAEAGRVQQAERGGAALAMWRAVAAAAWVELVLVVTGVIVVEGLMLVAAAAVAAVAAAWMMSGTERASVPAPGCVAAVPVALMRSSAGHRQHTTACPMTEVSCLPVQTQTPYKPACLKKPLSTLVVSYG
jgi:hypothetical protein